ncbi:MAG TPA: LysM domain-containing protein, partial [Thermoanaerobaculia bacterium]|nr:LysM domain-containing protein [Thermoanaerobaculia bacterium]
MNSFPPILSLALFFFAGQTPQSPEPPLPTMVVGNAGSYTVEPGDSLTSVGARLGIPWTSLARSNGLRSDALLRIGQSLDVDNRHIVPAARDDGILINVP